MCSFETSCDNRTLLQLRAIMTIIFLVLTAAVAVPERSSAATQGSQPDTSQWKIHRSAQWGFYISAPPDWDQLSIPMGNSRMTLRRKLDPANTKSLSCSISTSDEPRTIGMSQQDINELMLRNGPPSIQEVQASINPTGSSYHVQETSLARIGEMTVYVYDLSGLFQRMDVQDVNREIRVSMFTPGKIFNFSCGVWADNVKDVNELYAQWLPTLRGIFSTVGIEPGRP
jgi:hypothetical protein